MKRLYDLSEDVGEKKNFFGQRPDLAAKLDAQWKKWDAMLAKPRWTPAPTRPDMDRQTDDGEEFHVDY